MAWIPLAPGTIIGETYQVGEVLGSGGFGITYAAVDFQSGEPVAIKEYFPRTMATRQDNHVYISDESHAEMFDRNLDRFWQEAWNLNRFNHPHIVKFVQRFAENGSAYIVLEYIEGDNLETWCQQDHGLPTREQIEPFAAALTSALDTIHRNNMLHRDIAPKNVLLRNGLPVLIDFGSAREVEANKPLTAMVSAHYAPWEQYLTSGTRQGAWTDIYGASATLYRVLMGRPPVDAMSRSVDDSQYVPVGQSLRGQYRQTFLDAVDWGLRFSPAKRPQSVTEWRSQLLSGITTLPMQSGLSLAYETTPEKQTVIRRVRQLLGFNE